MSKIIDATNRPKAPPIIDVIARKQRSTTCASKRVKGFANGTDGFTFPHRPAWIESLIFLQNKFY